MWIKIYHRTVCYTAVILDFNFLCMYFFTYEIQVTSSLKVSCNQLTNNRHPFSITVEIQDGKDIVSSFNPHFTYSDSILCSWKKNIAKVSGCCNKGPFVWGSCLVIELTCIIETVKRRERQDIPEHYRGTWTPQLKNSHPFFRVIENWMCKVLSFSEVVSNTLLQHLIAVHTEERD